MGVQHISIKTDLNGVLAKTFGGPQKIQVYLFKTLDGGYLLSGSTMSLEQTRYYLIKWIRRNLVFGHGAYGYGG
jgi:hypothetical protein